MDIDQKIDMMGNSARLRDVAMGWTKEGVKLLDKESTDCKSEERASFYMTAAADLAARMYVEIQKDFEKRHDKATARGLGKKLLESTFSAIGLLMRAYGAEVQMQIKLDFAEVANVKENGAEVPAHVGTKDCKCALDQDGWCGECSRTFRTLFSKLGEATTLLREAGMENREFCMPCIPRHMDAALAHVIENDFRTMTAEMAEASIGALFMASQNIAALPMPLTKKAWDEHQKKS